METKTHKNVVLISGGTSGIGKAVLLRLLSEGHFVATFAPETEEEGDCAKEFLQNHSEQLLFLKGDVQSDSDVKQVVEKTIEKFGKIDVLINNAGVPYYVECDQVDAKKFLMVLDINLVGPARLIKEVVPGMKSRGEGLIINMVSTAGLHANARSECYSATKFGLRGFSQAIRSELREFGIKVATISPGVANTKFLGPEMEQRTHKEHSLLETEDIARVISFIVDQPKRAEVRDIILTPFGSDRYHM